MPNLIRIIISVLAGMIFGGAINMSIVVLGNYLIPLPEGFDLSQVKKTDLHLALSPRHLIFPWFAHALGTLAGAVLGGVIYPGRHLMIGLMIGFFFFLGGLANAFYIPAPLGFIILDLSLAYFPMAWIGAKLSLKIPVKQG